MTKTFKLEYDEGCYSSALVFAEHGTAKFVSRVRASHRVHGGRAIQADNAAMLQYIFLRSAVFFSADLF